MAENRSSQLEVNDSLYERIRDRFFSWTNPWRVKHRFWSTFTAALVLALLWVSVWMFIFFVSTAALGLQTSILAFIVTFWLSIVAEAVIRWAENTNVIARFSKPHLPKPSGDNDDFDWNVASKILLVGIVVLFIVLFLWSALGQGNKVRSFVPPLNSETFNGIVLVDKSSLVVRRDDCREYPKDALVSISKDGLRVDRITESGRENITEKFDACRRIYEISPGERIKISGPDDPNLGQATISRMFDEWGKILRNPAFLLTIFIGILFRIWIYKRSHRVSDSSST